MTTGTPYIGSRISLVSKAEIRYEGILYDVDSKDATVTLSKVKSFGTENRQAPKQIPPRNEVYEYIIFRGSDIKDLSVSELGNKDESPHLDPAIVSAQTVPPVPSSHSEPNPAFLPRNPGGTSSILPTPPHPVPPGGGYTQFPPPGYNPFGMPPYFGRPPLMMGQHLPPRPMNSPANQGHQIPHPSTPPTHISSISSISQSVSSTSQKTPQSSTTTVAPPTNPKVVPSTTSTITSQFTPAIADSTDITPQTLSRNTTGDKPQTSTATEHHQPSTDSKVTDLTNISNTTTTNATSRPVESQRHSSSPTTISGNDGRRQARRGGYRDNRDNQQQRYPNYTSKGPRVVNSWRGGGDRGYARTPRRGGVSSRPSQPDPQPLKYTEDFDFESANALFSKDQFEKEIKSKLQIDDQKEGEANVNDHAPQEDEGRVEEVVVEGDKEENSVDENYDKTKSFFDSLTCESNKQNTNRRSNRSHDMALNTETFGTTNRGYFGRPRRNHGRGGYNYRHGGGRGGYNHYNGYSRGGGGYRGRGGYQEGRGGYQEGRGGYQERRGGYQERRGGNRTYEDRSYGNQDGGRNS